MRELKYLSPTGISSFFDNRSEYYLKYCAEKRPPKPAQTKPMSVGSAFDAYVKNYLHTRLFGRTDPEFEIDTLLKVQVEEHNQEWAFKAGKRVFDQYKYSGALASIMRELQLSDGEPRFEFRLEREVDGIPFLGYPDLYFKLPSGRAVIYDFKVNGYCNLNNTSPKKGYKICRDGWDHSKYEGSRTHNKQHKDYFGQNVDGIEVSMTHKFEDVDQSWSNQLCIYGWLLGEMVGGQFIVGIEQICGPALKMRMASHRAFVSKDYQRDLMAKAKLVWECVASGHVFYEIPREESDAKCIELDQYYKAYLGGSTPKDRWFTEITRGY